MPVTPAKFHQPAHAQDTAAFGCNVKTTPDGAPLLIIRRGFKCPCAGPAQTGKLG